MRVEPAASVGGSTEFSVKHFQKNHVQNHSVQKHNVQ